MRVAFGWLIGRNCSPSSWLTPCKPPVYPLYAPCIEYACHWLAFGSFVALSSPYPGWRLFAFRPCSMPAGLD